MKGRLLLRLLFWVTLIGFFWCLAPIQSYAATALVAPASPSPIVFGIHVDTAAVLGVLSGTVIPGLSALLARTHWDPFWMGVITLALSTVDGFVTEWAKAPDLSHYNWFHAAILAVGTFALGVFANSAIWRGTTKQRKLLEVGSAKTG